MIPNNGVIIGSVHRVDSVLESSLASKIMHLFIWDETFVRSINYNTAISENLVVVR